jgi:hypothetical protein
VDHILGKVTGHGDEQSGPDVLLDLVVERDWLREAKTLDIELPRHLCCASCKGAGCNICGQSGALTLRGRAELGEIVRVTLPQQDPDSVSSTDSTRVLTIKVPGYGGLPEPNSSAGLRGRLLIRISTSGPVSSCIRAVAPIKDLDALGEVPSAVIPAKTQVAAAPTSRVSEPPSATVNAAGANMAITQATAEVFTKTTRSVIPVPATAAIRLANPKPPKARSPKSAVEPSIGWTWRDTLIGVVVLILGAVAAWVFISPQ